MRLSYIPPKVFHVYELTPYHEPQLNDPDICMNHNCQCHTNPDWCVRTPFPIEYGNPYCCNICHKVRSEIVNSEEFNRRAGINK